MMDRRRFVNSADHEGTSMFLLLEKMMSRAVVVNEAFVFNPWKLSNKRQNPPTNVCDLSLVLIEMALNRRTTYRYI